METQLEPAKKLDLRGLSCPEPVFRTKDEIGTIQIGEYLQVVADDPASEEDITRWAKRTGHELLSIEKDGKDLTFLVRRAK